MAQAETEKLTRIICGAALSRAVIIHDWNDEQSVQILNNCRKVIPKNGRLLIVEAVVPSGNEPSLAKGFDMLMLVLPGGIERTEEEYKLLLKH